MPEAPRTSGDCGINPAGRREPSVWYDALSGAATKPTSGRSSTREGDVDHASGPLGRLRPGNGGPNEGDIAEAPSCGKAAAVCRGHRILRRGAGAGGGARARGGAV